MPLFNEDNVKVSNYIIVIRKVGMMQVITNVFISHYKYIIKV